MNLAYRLSDFAHFVPVGGDMFAAYNSLTFGVLFIHKETAHRLSEAVGGIFSPESLGPDTESAAAFIRELEDRRLVFPVGQRRDLDDYARTRNILARQGLGILYLMLADGCNLACRYCYIERQVAADRPFKLMPAEIAEDAIEIFARNRDRHMSEPQVILYGGEPLLNRPVFKFAVEKVLRMKDGGTLPEKTGITLNTNGVLIDDDFAAFVKGKGIAIAVSLDGTEKMHNAMRPNKSGQGSYDSVMRACDLMRRAGVDFGFSITINGQNIHQLEEVLLWVHEEFGAQSIGFNILVDRHPSLLGMSEEDYADEVTEQLIRCFRICREKGIYEDRIMRKVNAFVKGYPYVYDCGAPGNQMVVTPEGRVGVCQGYCPTGKYFVPLSELGEASSHPIWNLWRYRSPVYQRQCYDCVAVGLCGGGCPYSADLKTGSIWGLDETFCTHAKRTIAFLIEDLYRQTQQRE